MKPQNIAVLGAGTMGIGIAEVAAAHGHQVKLYDLDKQTAIEAIARLAQCLAVRVNKNKISEQEKQKLLNNIYAVDDLKQLSDSHLIIEAVIERLAVKQELFASLEAICQPHTLLASNTSSISITAIASNLKHPQRVLGLHFFNPAPVMKLVEVIAGIKTDSKVLQVAAELVETWGKVAVKAQSGPGFIVNRVARPYYGEALKIKQEQMAGFAKIDACLQAAAGFRMGPFALMDLIGIDVNFQVSQTVYHAMFEDPRYRPSLIQSEMVAAGLLGRKSGRGFYQYDNPEVADSSPYETNQQSLPQSIQVADSGHPFEQLLASMKDVCTVHTGGLNLVGDTLLLQTVGRRAKTLAQQLNQPVCLVDWSFDYRHAKAVNVCFSEQVSTMDRNHIIALFQGIGKQVIIVDDVPAMINARVLSMLINEAADAVFNGVASVDDIDLAMRFGTNYPQGLLAFAQQLGWQNPASVLTELQQWFGDDRYRLSPYIRRQL